MDDLLKILNRLRNGTTLILKFSDYDIEGSINTIYETNNEADEDSSDYLELYACAFEVIRFTAYDNCQVNYYKGELIEITQYNSPERILSIDGKQIWAKLKFVE